jgi:arylsulfatase A-like enzyme
MSQNRRQFLQHSAAAAAALACARQGAGLEYPPKRPNFVVLFTDDQRFDTVAALGNPAIRTPNMDRLAARGTAFTQATIMGGLHGAICVPSRAMLHTGRHLFHLDGPGDVIPAKYTSLPETLRAAGYRTYATGKWHNDRPAFNRMYNNGGPIFFGGMNDHFNAAIYDYDPTGAYPKTAERTTAGIHDAQVYTDAAVNFLQRDHDDNPFFLYVAYTMPHDPRTAPPEYQALYKPSEIELPPNFLPKHPFNNGDMSLRDEQLAPWPRTPEVIRQHLADYYASITYVDAQIGRVLDALDAKGLTENTIVVFAGDNGLAVGRHGLMGKQSLYDHSIRVPMIFAGPGIPEITRRDTPCYHHDIYPTLCAAAGVPAPATVESTSLLPAMHDATVRPYASTFHAYRNVQRAVRKDGYKLIKYSVGGETHTQLFNLSEDPWEMNDLSEKDAPRVAALQSTLDEWQQHAEFH